MLLIGATAADMSWWVGGVGSFSVVVVGSAAVAPYCSLPRCRCHPSAASPPPLPMWSRTLSTLSRHLVGGTAFGTLC